MELKMDHNHANHGRNIFAGPKILSNKRNTGRGAALHRILLQRITSGGTAHRNQHRPTLVHRAENKSEDGTCRGT
jgi:hypothetical protein